jgi:hypothetical protein
VSSASKSSASLHCLRRIRVTGGQAKDEHGAGTPSATVPNLDTVTGIIASTISDVAEKP